MCKELKKINLDIIINAKINSQDLVEVMADSMVDEDVFDFIREISKQISDKNIIISLREFFDNLINEKNDGS